MDRRTVKVTTTNKLFKEEIEVEIEVDVPESYEEATGEDFYNGEEKVVAAIQDDWCRRKGNAARAVLRHAETRANWQDLAQSTSDGYVPGRRAGGAPEINEDELEGISIADLKQLLLERGVKLRAAGTPA